MATLTVFADTADDYIQSSNATYSTARDGSGLTTFSGNAFVQVGQYLSGTYNIFETFIAFDTSALGASAIVTSAILSMDGVTDGSTTDFNVDARLYDWGTAVTTGDWPTGATLAGTTLLGQWNTSGFSTAYNAFSDIAMAANVNLTGVTRMLLASANTVANSAPSGFEYVILKSADAPGTTEDPKLVITYTSVVEVSLAGAQPAATGEIAALSYKALAGAQAAPSGALTADQTLRHISAAGSQTAPSGALVAKRVLTHIALAGAQAAPSGLLHIFQPEAVAGVQAAPSGALLAALLRMVAGAQPGAFGTLSADAKRLAAAVAFDASSESHTGTTGSTSAASFSWTHTPVGAAKGVLVFVITAANASYISSVTYGGVTVPAVSGGQASDTSGEPGRCNAFFLGSGVPQGAQSVVVNRTNNATVMYAVAVTVTCVGDTEVYTPGIVLVQNNGTVAEQSVTDGTPGANSVRFAGGWFGHATIPTAGANSTLLQSIDFGANGAAVSRETTAGQGSRSVGLSSGTSDDRAIVHLAVRGRARAVWVAGEQAGPAGTVAAETNVVTPVSLAGAQAVPSGALSAQLLLLRSVAGAQPAGAGALVALFRNKLLTGAQVAPAGALALEWLFRQIGLAGVQGAPQGDVGALQQAFASVAGAQPGDSGTIAGHVTLAHLGVAGEQASPAGLIAAHFSLSSVGLAGNQAAAAGALVGLYLSKLLAGSQDAPSGTVVGAALQVNVGFGPVAGRAVAERELAGGRATNLALPGGRAALPKAPGSGRGRLAP